ncbi:MAG: ComEA family DNA-binding protein [Beijerinckiaceae bacterium]
MIRKIVSAAALTIVMTGSAFSQATQPAAPTAPARPAMPAPAAPASPATAQPARPAAAPATAPAAQGQRVNLNTATAAELDKLPQIGDKRAQDIITARGKGRFKDWNDFVARNVVPKNAEDAIKDKVRF